MGTVTLAGDVPEGASVFVDNRLRGKLPWRGPLRLSKGVREIRVEKEGFEPIAALVEVGAGRDSVAWLVAKTRQGRLVVSEKHNWALQVELDGEVVGVTPWEGPATPGEHEVRLRGFVGLAALAECVAPEAGAPGTEAAQEGATMASPVETAAVRLFEVTRVTLGAEEQDASLRIESTPSGARVMIDSKGVGWTPWEGRLSLGEHAIEVSAGGFVSSTQPVRLVRRKQRELSVVLEPEPDLAGLRRMRNVAAGVGFGVGALGLGVSAVTGALAWGKVSDLKSVCQSNTCPPSEQENLNAARRLETLATVGLVVGSLGVAAGTIVFFALKPKRGERRADTASRTTQAGDAMDWRVGVGPGRLQMEGSF
jgi:PEGA domain